MFHWLLYAVFTSREAVHIVSQVESLVFWESWCVAAVLGVCASLYSICHCCNEIKMWNAV